LRIVRTAQPDPPPGIPGAPPTSPRAVVAIVSSTLLAGVAAGLLVAEIHFFPSLPTHGRPNNSLQLTRLACGKLDGDWPAKLRENG
jgi:hypothetical protein